MPRYEPDVGVTRLETVRVSRAAADQRRGRAGRTEPGVCYRLWDEPQTAALEPYARPEILAADLSSFALDLAAWGSAPEQLAFLDPPPRPALTEAKALLAELGAIDADGRITDEGRHLRRLPLPPRLARMVVDAARARRGAASRRDRRDHRRARARRRRRRFARAAQCVAPRPLTPRPRRPRHGGALGGDRDDRRLARQEETELTVGALIALAYPERIAKNRGGGTGAFLLANGRGAGDRCRLAAGARAVSRGGRTDRQRRGWPHPLAAPITLAEIEARFADRIEARDEITFDRGERKPARPQKPPPRRDRAFGAADAGRAERSRRAKLLAEDIARIGIDRLPWTKALTQWRDRVMFLRASEGRAKWPDLSDAALAESASEWLAPTLLSKTGIGQITADELGTALRALLPWPLPRRLDAEAPTHFEAPTGSHVPIDYEAEGGPKIAIRVQELFGLEQPSDDRRRQNSAADRAFVAGASAGADDARPARLLARQLCRGARRDARPLSETSVARRSDRRAADAARQAAQDIIAILAIALTRRSPSRCKSERAVVAH